MRERERPGSAAHQVWVELQVEIDLVVTVTWQSQTRSNAKKRKTPSREYFRESEGNAQKFLIRCSNNLLTVHLGREKNIRISLIFTYLIPLRVFTILSVTCRSKAVASPVEEREGQTSASSSGQSGRQPRGLYDALEPVLL